ncbi:MAG: hypothetical protein K1X28_03605 [Parachlamydiales bacterium]|nr:hypothetical protein [Parachlamydiales bacterium]
MNQITPTISYDPNSHIFEQLKPLKRAQEAIAAFPLIGLDDKGNLVTSGKCDVCQKAVITFPQLNVKGTMFEVTAQITGTSLSKEIIGHQYLLKNLADQTIQLFDHSDGLNGAIHQIYQRMVTQQNKD